MPQPKMSFASHSVVKNARRFGAAPLFRYSKAGVSPSTEGKRIIYNTLYEKEKRRALEKAAREGEEVFNICPICRRLICNECFLICDDLDLCRACALRLGEAGEPVSGKSNETAHVRKTTAALK